MGIARLILLNGPPGVGKSALAGRLLDDHPLMLLVDIDALRVSLGGWESSDESKLVARDLAVTLVESHLSRGHDVVVPQYLGRIEFVLTLEGAAKGAGATFVEVVLTVDESVLIDRFRSRRRELGLRGGAHPEGDVFDDKIGAAVADAVARLASVVGERAGTRTVTAEGDLEATYAALLAAIGPAEGR